MSKLISGYTQAYIGKVVIDCRLQMTNIPCQLLIYFQTMKTIQCMNSLCIQFEQLQQSSRSLQYQLHIHYIYSNVIVDKGTKTHYTMLQYTHTHYTMLQNTQTHYTMLQYTQTHYAMLQYTQTHYTILQYTQQQSGFLDATSQVVWQGKLLLEIVHIIHKCSDWSN